ncbi:hypothetical protein EVAR_27938_1 [Eumeta japonica]|uniref:Uncharacterized protein n=1 Tax=Eumeta variegata TaxID=151549 RepID=A0A4C1UX24_EUMVA|nr:hypothetical protein EVAR_27938_1 [Eumeta japonica]
MPCAYATFKCVGWTGRVGTRARFDVRAVSHDSYPCLDLNADSSLVFFGDFGLAFGLDPDFVLDLVPVKLSQRRVYVSTNKSKPQFRSSYRINADRQKRLAFSKRIDDTSRTSPTTVTACRPLQLAAFRTRP